MVAHERGEGGGGKRTREGGRGDNKKNDRFFYHYSFRTMKSDGVREKFYWQSSDSREREK
jgi:hypothetical protein